LNRTLSRFDGPPPIVICLRVQMSRVMHETAPVSIGDTATKIGAGIVTHLKKSKALQKYHNCIGVIILVATWNFNV
jgi:hypothetical protein